ncbi:MAG: IS4 family transposase [Lachnospiraceae bacterium]|nr:IS4 family transposase [Lachnospiraceae bacterium]
MNPFSICQSIIESIRNLLHSKELLEAYRLPNRFVRSSGKLTMLHVIAYLFYTTKQAMHTNVSLIRLDLPELEFPKVSKQAVSKARQGIVPALFQKLFYLSTDIFYQNIVSKKKWLDKFNIFAIDGSRISIPRSASNFKKYGEMFSLKDPKRRWSMALCSTIYDVCNDFIVHGLLTGYLGSERAAALQHCADLEKLGQFKDSIIIFDRGYYSEKMFRYFADRSYLCVMRLKENYNLAKECKGDSIQFLKGNPKEDTEDVAVRVVAIPLDSGETEYLATNVFDISLTPKDFKVLYFLRWPIESKYGELKNQFQLEEFSGATSTSIEQEFFINLLLSNLAALLKSSADEEISRRQEGRKNKYRYQANRAHIIGRLKWFIPRFFAGSREIGHLMDIFDDSCIVLSQIQPGRKCIRKKKKSDQERKHFNNRKRVI